VDWSREDLAWCAGIFEGEGSFSFSRVGGRTYVKATVAMTDHDVVERFASTVGFGSVTYPYPPSWAGRKPKAVWSTHSFEKVQALAAATWPWLGARRRARVTELIGLAQEGR
jgi:hypothetical protein